MAGRPVSEEEYHALNATIEAERAAATNEAIMRARVAQNAAYMATPAALLRQEVQRQELSRAMEANWLQARSVQHGRPPMGQMAHPQVRPQSSAPNAQPTASAQDGQQQRQLQQQQQKGGSSGSTNPLSNSHGTISASASVTAGVNSSTKTSLPSNGQGMIPIGFFRDPRGNAWAASLQHPTHSAPPVDANFWAIRQQQVAMGRGGVQLQPGGGGPLMLAPRQHQQRSQQLPHENQVIEIDSENDDDDTANMPDDSSKSSTNTQNRFSTQSMRSSSPEAKKTAERSELERMQHAAQVEYARMSAKRAIALSSTPQLLDPANLPIHLTHLAEMAKRAPGTTHTYPLNSGKGQRSNNSNNSSNNSTSGGNSNQSKTSNKHSVPASSAASPPAKRSRSSSASSNIIGGTSGAMASSKNNASLSKQQLQTHNPASTSVISDAEMQERYKRARLAVAMSESKSTDSSSSTTRTANTKVNAGTASAAALAAMTTANNKNNATSTSLTRNPATMTTATNPSFKRTLLASPFIKGYLTNHTMRMADQSREVKTVVDKVLLAATGYTTDTAPSSIPFPPHQLNLDYDQLEEVAMELVQERHEHVGDSVRRTYSEMKARHDEILKAEHAKQNMEERLRQEMASLQQRHKKALTVVLKRHAAEKEEWEEKMKELQEEVAMHKAAALEHKATQANSLETMMKASILSLRMIRKKEHAVTSGGGGIGGSTQ